MTYTQARNIQRFCAGLFSEPDWREVAEKLAGSEDDFEVDGVRFIADDSILEILADELGSDNYILGCFNASFLSGITGIDRNVFDAMRKAGAYEAVGKLIKSLGKLEEVAEEYAKADGFGHHFNWYDFGEEEFEFEGQIYHVFDKH